ncbi:MAG: DUF4365 domain-containing protein, partial [Gemmatimonadales bacterium]
MSGLPKVGTARTASLGVSIVSDAVFRPQKKGGLGFVFREQLAVDVGVDGHIEIVDQQTEEVVGKFVGVQIKAGASYFVRRTEVGWTIPVSKTTVTYWRQYSVPVILAVVDTEQNLVYWVLVSSGGFRDVGDNFAIEVPRAQQLNSDAADTIADLAIQAPTALATTFKSLTDELSEATIGELNRHKSAWREGRRADARLWLDSLTRSATRLAAIDPEVAGKVLRYAAGVLLEESGDVERARSLVAEARRRDSDGPDDRLRAVLLARDGDVESALSLLAEDGTPTTQILRASILANMGRKQEAVQVL